jgi:hypothetical protein
LGQAIVVTVTGTVRSWQMAVVTPTLEDRSSVPVTHVVATSRNRRPRAWLFAIAFASFLTPCHAPIMDAASSAYPFFCTLLPWPAW